MTVVCKCALSPAATIGFESLVYSVAEDGGLVNLTVKVLNGSLQRSVRVQLDTRDDTALGKLMHSHPTSQSALGREGGRRLECLCLTHSWAGLWRNLWTIPGLQCNR